MHDVSEALIQACAIALVATVGIAFVAVGLTAQHWLSARIWPENSSIREFSDRTWQRYHSRWIPVAVKRVIPILVIAVVVLFVLGVAFTIA